MAAATQQPQAKPPNANAAAGVLPVSTSGLKPKVLSSHAQPSRHGAAGLKVVIRRLPPGLTEDEFYSSVGSEWKAGGSKVDWASYVPGKVSRDPAKHSRPARAYLHLAEGYLKEFQPADRLKALGDKLADAQFNDARNTYNDPALLNPWPTLSEAPYGRMPSSKIRKDNRQGTIDQDQEFIDFLQELTNPVVRPTPIDALPDRDSKAEDKIVTPLVQYLKDKKANKHKDASTGGKGQKQGKHDSKDAKAANSTQDKKQSSKASKATPADRKGSTSQKSEKPTKEAVKLLNKPAAPSAAKTQSAAQPAAPQPAAPAPTPAKQERKRERGSAAAAAKILQRDLGLGGAPTGRRRGEGSSASKDPSVKAASAPAAGSTNPQTQAQSAAQATAAAGSAAAEAKEVSKPNAQASAASKDLPGGKQSSKGAKALASGSKAAPAASTKPVQVSPTATQAFLKHANPSQGITEALLESTFAGFGTVTKVEIDKKKGFAYVDFAEPTGLQKAVGASPVKIAQGQVVVLERKAQPQGGGKQTKPAEGKGGKGASGAGGGGGGGSSSQRGGRGRGRGRGAREESQGRKDSASSATAGDAGKPAAASGPVDAP